MKLQTGERIIKIYHHHIFFFIWRSIKTWCASMPFFLVAYFFAPLMGNKIYWFTNFFIIVLFALVHIYDLTVYYLDKLILTNQRVLHLDWIHPFKYLETQATLSDIQNVESIENGFLAYFPIFDFGTFLAETASTKTKIMFPEAPDPKGIKYFLTNLTRKHQGIIGSHYTQQNTADIPAFQSEISDEIDKNANSLIPNSKN